ncbi:PREDICTED: uncharacterized protein LOC104733344 [Camelina sativa]|uniref:Uncharacterized protein LOC104733344 n=1 Tax=Camelina sativa TaxID=90675 RepID=A0ABM0V5T0_CAMSA|nr:PREDICTED: uncharacterized protein LOC104733344 [Camelina sativa]
MASAEAIAYAKWRMLADIEERFLQQKAKLHWLKTGDQNNIAFHSSAKLREMKNNIKEIHCDDGRVADTHDRIKFEAERYFKTFLNYSPADYVECSKEELADILDYKCDEHDKNILTREASWSVVGEDCAVAIQSFFQTGFLPKGVNSTILALIPKKKEARTMKDYRPISCCNVLYKIISKILANRLKLILPKFISSNQSAFIKDRLLMENILLATELVKDYHKDSVSPRCAMKIDISKAFDSVQWGFLLNTMHALEFPDTYIHWIRTCITSALFSVQVNSELAGYFGSKRGLRQGCSLSPYMFVICMNVLSRRLDRAALHKKFGFHPNCQSLNLTHLCFADDLMVFIDGKKQSIEGVLEVFTDFATHSGLHISIEKSTLYMAGVSPEHKEEILNQFPFEYGRLQLLQSVIFSLTNFWISAFRLPKACVKEIDKLCSAFLWDVPSLNPKKAKVAWSDVCLPKKEGGLGLRSIEEANKVCILKLIWRILSAKGSLWVNWVHRHLIRTGSFWAEQNTTTTGSWIWRKLLKYRTIAKQFYRVQVRNGESTSFWFDNWCSLGSLHEQLGDRGSIALGIPLSSTVAEVMAETRQRRHRQAVLNQIEEEILKHKLSQNVEGRMKLSGKGATMATARNSSQATHGPLFEFLILLLRGTKLSTGDKLQRWNTGAHTGFVLCNHPLETTAHLFFQCPFSQRIWEALVKKLLLHKFTIDWQAIMTLLGGVEIDKTTKFITGYAFQNTIHSIWLERNARRHGDQPATEERLVKLIDKNICNRLSTLRNGEDTTIQTWFAARFY